MFSLEIGKYKITQACDDDPEKVWISKNDGEGGNFSIAQLEEAIAEFWNKYF